MNTIALFENLQIDINDLLSKCEKDDSLKITDLKSSPASKAGEHCSSEIVRVNVMYDTRLSKANSKSFIVKVMLEPTGTEKERLLNPGIFDTEISIYAEIIPKIEGELRRIGDDTVLAAKMLYYCLEPKKCIILEDVSPRGYVVLDRMLDFAETRSAFLKLAKWHAVSYKLADEGDHLVTKYNDSFFNIKDFEDIPCVTAGISDFINKLETIEELKVYVPKFRALQGNLVKRCISSFNAYRRESPRGVFALCHGDFHATNLMFKKNENGEVLDVMMLDFQLSSFGPLVLDLIFALYMMVDADVRENQREELVDFYWSNFIATLRRLNFEGKFPEIRDLHLDMARHSHYEIWLFVCLIPICYAMDDESVNFDEILTSADARRRSYDNPLYLNEVKRVLPVMAGKRMLD